MFDLNRYHRQMLLEGIGEHGQRRLRDAAALIVGCGALGTVAADALARAGVGRLRLVDRDVVELTNLQRQVLFDESDALRALPKAVAAAQRLARVNSQITIEPIVADFSAANAERLAGGCDVLLDGADNFETRFLLNDVAVRAGLPYIYGGAVAMRGMVYTVLPHTPGGRTPWERNGVAGPCLRCVFDAAPSAGLGETCDTVGVLGPAAAMVANLQAAEAVKLLSGNVDRVGRGLRSIDLWSDVLRSIDLAGAYEAGRCVCCGQRRFEYLDGERGSSTTRLCGRHAVQITVRHNGTVDLASAARRLRAHGPVRRNEYLVRADLTEREVTYRLTLFPDGRAIVHGTDDPALARGLYSRYVGL